MNLHDATRLEVRFSAAKFTIMDLTKWRVSPRTSSKKLILYFSWCSFQHFKKLTWVSAVLPMQGKTAEKLLECAQRSMAFTQFIVKLRRTIFSWDRSDMILSQQYRKWREYSNLKSNKNVSERRAKRSNFTNSFFRILYDRKTLT